MIMFCIIYMLPCSFCINQEESLKHLLFDYSISRMVWSTLFHGRFLTNVSGKMMDRWILSKCTLNLNSLIQEWLLCCYTWLFRNKVLFKGYQQDLMNLIRDGRLSFSYVRSSLWNNFLKPFIVEYCQKSSP